MSGAKKIPMRQRLSNLKKKWNDARFGRYGKKRLVQLGRIIPKLKQEVQRLNAIHKRIGADGKPLKPPKVGPGGLASKGVDSYAFGNEEVDYDAWQKNGLEKIEVAEKRLKQLKEEQAALEQGQRLIVFRKKLNRP